MSGSDPRPQHNANNSVLYAGRPTAQEDLSWLDFLRTAGGTVPADPPTPPPPLMGRSDSADRKRRHTGSEPERRSYPYPSNNARPSDPRLATGSSFRAGVGSGRDIAIDLSTPPRVPRPSFDQIMRMASEEHLRARRESDSVLPPWQPDADVTKCPVCQTEFSFWYRKHHCRKCGRIVCSNCSPHRITIPRQYIVQPPNPYEDGSYPASPGGGSRANPALGGGEIVRVCNPCVPDPWTPSAAATATSGIDTDPHEVVPRPPSRPAPRISSAPRLLHTRDEQPRDTNERDRPDRYRTVSVSNTASRTRAYTDQSFPTLNRAIPHVRDGPARTLGSARQDGHYPRISSRYGHRYSQSDADRQRMPDPTHLGRPAPPVPDASASIAPVRQREVKEEDECPVCGVELPPGESLRELHIRQCIETRFSSTPTQSSRPAPASREASTTPLASVSSGTPPVLPEGSRPRATSYRPRGMALYKATEKDCTTEDGEPQECVICFEEFEAGDDMGRMECLCKFHRRCIRQWWDTKGAGSCPTHQLHE